MMDIMMVVFPVLFVAVFIFTIFNIIKRQAEIKKYKVLIVDTNDRTVLEWLEAFKKTRNFNTRSSFHINLGSSNTDNSYLVDDKLRYIQVWEIVKDSSNVSANVKEQVKKTLLLESIPIKP